MPFAARGGFTFVADVGPQLWTPADSANTVIWLDASDASTLTLSGTSVTQWDNKADSGATAYSQGTASKQPTYNSTDDRVEFDGSTDIMYSGTRFGLPAAPAYNCVYLAEWPNGTLNSIMRTMTIGQYVGSMSWAVGSQQTSFRFNNGNERFNNVSNNTKTLQSFTQPLNGNHGSGDYYLNGTIQTATASGGTSNLRTDTTAESALGGGDNLSSGASEVDLSNIKLYELVWLDSNDTDERQRVEGYIAWKWGVEGNLPVSHPYYSGAPTV